MSPADKIARLKTALIALKEAAENYQWQRDYGTYENEMRARSRLRARADDAQTTLEEIEQ